MAFLMLKTLPMSLPSIQNMAKPGEKPAKRKAVTDVVALVAGHDGVPAVRVRKAKDGTLEITAAAVLDLPGELPDSPEAAEADLTRWSLPRAFQAARAAIAVASPQGSLRFTEEVPDADAVIRCASVKTEGDLPSLVASLPEYQAAWTARLFPEGRRPTACSIQLASSAALNVLLAAGGKQNVVAFLASPSSTALVGLQGGKPVFYREYGEGQKDIRAALMSNMRIDEEMAESILNDAMVDPTPVIEPILRPLFRQAEIAGDYLMRRGNAGVDRFVVVGLKSGLRYWSSIFELMTGQVLTEITPDAGLRWGCRKPDTEKAGLSVFTAAFGAARAVLEEA